MRTRSGVSELFGEGDVACGGVRRETCCQGRMAARVADEDGRAGEEAADEVGDEGGRWSTSRLPWPMTLPARAGGYGYSMVG